MLDLYGTPYSEKLHVVERYRLIDYEAAKEGLERDRKENLIVVEGRDPNYRGKHLQVHFTVEDENVFTMPWTATITYRPAVSPPTDLICAENPREPDGKLAKVPQADKPDFCCINPHRTAAVSGGASKHEMLAPVRTDFHRAHMSAANLHESPAAPGEQAAH